MTLRGMPSRFLADAPDLIRKSVLDIIAIRPAAPLDFDVVFRQDKAAGPDDEITGLDFGNDGSRGCHFFLKPYDMRAYRERNRRKRVAWRDLPPATKKAITAYLKTN